MFVCACVFIQVIERGRMVEVMVNFLHSCTCIDTHAHAHNGRLLCKSIHELCLLIVLPIMHLVNEVIDMSKLLVTIDYRYNFKSCTIVCKGMYTFWYYF